MALTALGEFMMYRREMVRCRGAHRVFIFPGYGFSPALIIPLFWRAPTYPHVFRTSDISSTVFLRALILRRAGN